MTGKTDQALVELQARRATAKAHAVLGADSEKVTANIDHVIGPPTQPDMSSLLQMLLCRPARRTIIVMEDQA